MAYRDDVHALEQRVAALSAELAVRVRERDEAARMLDEARARAAADAYLADLATGGPARRRRTRLRIAATVAGLAMIVGGLFAYRARTHRDRLGEAMQQFEHFAGEMCQCRDSTCAMQVSDAMTRWGTAMQKEWTPPPKLDEATMKRATAIGTRLGDCMSKAMVGNNPAQLAQ
jgi:hypothetical protein